jgi:hypothetical protein
MGVLARDVVQAWPSWDIPATWQAGAACRVCRWRWFFPSARGAAFRFDHAKVIPLGRSTTFVASPEREIGRRQMSTLCPHLSPGAFCRRHCPEACHQDPASGGSRCANVWSRFTAMLCS